MCCKIVHRDLNRTPRCHFIKRTRKPLTGTGDKRKYREIDLPCYVTFNYKKNFPEIEGLEERHGFESQQDIATDV